MFIISRFSAVSAAWYKRRTSPFFVRLMLMVVLISLSVLLGADLWASRERELASAHRDAGNLTHILERHITASVIKIDIVLRQAIHDYSPVVNGQKKMSTFDINRDLLRLMDMIPEAQKDSLRIIDANGKVIYSAGKTEALPNVVVADRAYFLRQKTDPQAGLVVSEPLLSRFTGKWLITLSRRIQSPNGDFAGVIQTAVRADYLQSFFQGLNTGSLGVIALYDTNLHLVARLPDLPNQLGKKYPLTEIKEALARNEVTGFYRVSSRVDGIKRDFIFRKVESLPFIVVVGLSEKDFLFNWNRKAMLYSISLLILSLELFGLIWIQKQSVAHYLKDSKNV